MCTTILKKFYDNIKIEYNHVYKNIKQFICFATEPKLLSLVVAINSFKTT